MGDFDIDALMLEYDAEKIPYEFFDNRYDYKPKSFLSHFLKLLIDFWSHDGYNSIRLDPEMIIFVENFINEGLISEKEFNAKMEKFLKNGIKDN